MKTEQIQELNELWHYIKERTNRFTPFKLGQMSLTELRKIKKSL